MLMHMTQSKRQGNMRPKQENEADLCPQQAWNPEAEMNQESHEFMKHLAESP